MRLFFRTAFIVIAFVVCSGTLAEAAELVMVELKSCTYCAKFQREVAPTYNNSSRPESWRRCVWLAP